MRLEVIMSLKMIQSAGFLTGMVYKGLQSRVVDTISGSLSEQGWVWLERDIADWWSFVNSRAQIPVVIETAWQDRKMFIKLVGRLGEPEFDARFLAMLPTWPEGWEVPEEEKGEVSGG
jgi:hypothetical protein